MDTVCCLHCHSMCFSDYISKYFKRYYKVGAQTVMGHDQYVYLHANNLAVIGIAPSHPILRTQDKVRCISFKQEKRDLTANQVSGSKKKQAFILRPEVPMCSVTMNDGSVHALSSVIRGKLIEINPKLTQNPNLILESPHDVGYICILHPRSSDILDITNSLLDEMDYKQHLKSLGI
jgi:hypothetical protein